MKKIKRADKQFQQKYKTQKCKQTCVVSTLREDFTFPPKFSSETSRQSVFDSSESDSDSLDSFSENSSSSEAVTNFIVCSRERRFDQDAIFFNLNFLLSVFVFIIKMNQSNYFIYISVYFKTSYSKNHDKKVARAL